MASVVNHTLEPTSAESPERNGLQEATYRTACLFNVVLFCPNPERVEYFQHLIQAIVEHFPCRIMFIQQIPGHPTQSLKTEMTTVKTKNSDHSVLCDQLIIEASRESLSQVPFILFPFILPDLPLFLVWDCDPTSEREILPKLQPHASRLIFDTETVDNLQSLADHLLTYHGANHADIVDLNWTRIGGWRELMYKMFDTEERIDHLQQAKTFQITYNGLENAFFHHNQTQAIYLQGWLASRLGWHFYSLTNHSGKSDIHYRTPVGETKITLQPTQIEERSPGSIFSLELLSTQGMRLLASRKPGTQQVTVKTSSDLSCTLPYILNLRGAQLTYPFLKEALYLYSSQHYKQMLSMIKQQNWNRN